jgi:hypothetical protein
MKNLRVLTGTRENLLTLAILIGMAIAAPLLIKQQLITGTIVNATLIIGVSMLGMREGLLIGLLPSSISLATGLLPPVLAPMVPFIIAGNCILVLGFGLLKNLNYWAGTILGSVLKFAFLYFTSWAVIGLLVKGQVAPMVAGIMGWNQLITALAGSLLAFGVLRVLRRESRAN